MASDPIAPVLESVEPSTTTRHLAYAEAAIVLLESVIIRLIERQIITKAEMIEAVEEAISTKRQMASDGEHPEISTIAAGVLQTLANSLGSGRDGNAR